LESGSRRRADGRGALSNLKSYLQALPLKGEKGVAATYASAKRGGGGGGGGDKPSKDKGKGLKVEDNGSDAVMAVREAAGEEEEEEEDAERECSDGSEDLVDQVTPESSLNPLPSPLLLSLTHTLARTHTLPLSHTHTHTTLHARWHTQTYSATGMQAEFPDGLSEGENIA
jgi:hypothetical protein